MWAAYLICYICLVSACLNLIFAYYKKDKTIKFYPSTSHLGWTILSVLGWAVGIVILLCSGASFEDLLYLAWPE